jgi:hypothetical protein
MDGGRLPGTVLVKTAEDFTPLDVKAVMGISLDILEITLKVVHFNKQFTTFIPDYLFVPYLSQALSLWAC